MIGYICKENIWLLIQVIVIVACIICKVNKLPRKIEVSTLQQVKLYNPKGIAERVFRIGEAYNTGIFLVISSLIIVLMYSLFIVKIDGSIEYLVNYKIALLPIVISYFTIVFTVLAVCFTMMGENIGLIHSKEEILRTYKVYPLFFILIVLLVIDIVYVVFFPEVMDEEKRSGIIIATMLYVYATVLIVAYTTFALFVLNKLAFSKEKLELKYSSKLYQVFWDEKPLALFEIDGVRLEKYFISILTQCKECRQVKDIFYLEHIFAYKRKTKIINLLCGIIITANFLLGFLELEDSLRNQNKTVFVVEGIVLLVSSCAIMYKKSRLFLKELLLKVVEGAPGFIVHGKNEESFIDGAFLPGIKNRKLKKYIIDVENIMAFYFIVLSNSTINSDCKAHCEKQIYMMIEYLHNKRDTWIGQYWWLYMPVFAAGYYVVSLCKLPVQEVLQAMRKLYQDMNLDEEQEQYFWQTLNSLLIDTHMKRTTKEEREFIKENSNNDKIDFTLYAGYKNLITGYSDKR